MYYTNPMPMHFGQQKEMKMKHEFQTLIGAGFAPVIVIMAYDTDEVGVFGEYIEKVLYEGIDISDCLHEDTLIDLTIKGEKDLKEWIDQEREEAEIAMGQAND